MKTERSSQRRLVGALIIVLAVAAAWAVMNRQSRRADREERSMLYQEMPVLKACGVHLTADDEHMLSHHDFVGIAFRQLDKRGREALLELARTQTTKILADQQLSDEEKQRSIDAVLEAVPQSLVGFQKAAPGSAYIFLDPRDPRRHIPLHVVPEAEHGPWRGYNVFEHHGADAHMQPPEEHEHAAPETTHEDAGAE